MPLIPRALARSWAGSHDTTLRKVWRPPWIGISQTLIGVTKFVSGLVMPENGLVLEPERPLHAVVIPLFGCVSAGLEDYLKDLSDHGLFIVLVDTEV